MLTFSSYQDEDGHTLRLTLDETCATFKSLQLAGWFNFELANMSAFVVQFLQFEHNEGKAPTWRWPDQRVRAGFERSGPRRRPR